jgi:hypothetical protein
MAQSPAQQSTITPKLERTGMCNLSPQQTFKLLFCVHRHCAISVVRLADA